MKFEQTHESTDISRVPLATLAQQLRQPLLQISQYAQAGAENQEQIDVLASTTVRLLDSYILSSQSDQLALPIEPVYLGAVLQEVLHELTPIAKQYDCVLQLAASGTSKLVATNSVFARAAFLSLGHSFIESASALDDQQAHTVLFALRQYRGNQTAGVFSPGLPVNARTLNQARKLAGKAPQQNGALSGSGSGVIVADALLQRMSNQLYASKFQKIPGLAAAFMKNQQLQLV